MLDHVLLEVGDSERSARFYDAVFFALGGRRLAAGEGEVAWGVDAPVLRLAKHRPGGPAPAPGEGARAVWHLALRAAGKAGVDAAHEAGVRAGGASDRAPGPAPEHGPRGYAARLRDPDGRRVELVSR